MVLRFISSNFRGPLLRKLGFWVLSFNGWVWRRLPPSLQQSRSGRRYGRFIHQMVLIQGWRHPNGGTYLLRNKPELELIQDIARSRPEGTRFRVAVLGCSIGMEVYSIRWQLRGLVPRLDVRLVGLDVDQTSIETARDGAYPLPEHAWMLTRLNDAEREEIIPEQRKELHAREQVMEPVPQTTTEST